MSYEPELRVKKLAAFESSRGNTLVVVAVMTNEAVRVWNDGAWSELKPIPGTPREREVAAREGLPVDDTEGES